MALVLLSAAAAAFAAAIVGDARLRTLAAGHAAPAALTRAQVDLLVVRPCIRDTAGVVRARWASGAWRARVDAREWRLSDSLRVSGMTRDLVLDARIPCPD